MQKDISMPVIRRLPRYYRFLNNLSSNGVKTVSSKELALTMHSTASQVRQDLSCFGVFGQQGIGYNVESLKEEISTILGVQNQYNVVLLGAGNLGRAVATHMNFNNLGFNLVAIFEKDESMIGNLIRGLQIKSDNEMEFYIKNNNVTTAFLCLPEMSAHTAIERLYNIGVKNFWNFSHYDITALHPDTIVENVHMSDSLMTLCYRITEEKNK